MADVSVEGAVKSGAEAVKHESGTMMRVWQHNATRMLRANERMMHGIMSTAKLQIELGQEVLKHRLDRMQSSAPESAAHTLIEQQTKEMEHLMVVMREISEEMRVSFAEAAKLLFEDIEEDAKAMQDASTATAKQAQAIIKTATSKALHKTEEAAETLPETAAKLSDDEAP